jgi:hypothetical protein
MLGQPMTARPFETGQRGAEILTGAHRAADRLSLIR